MNREILVACAPWGAALAVLCGLFVLIARISGGRWQPRRVAALHRCESGAVQSLAFVLTLPILVTILLFIVQVSQLMIALVVVNYAAFASARAASVWTPTMIADQYAGLGGDPDGDDQNELPPPIMPGLPIVLNAASVDDYANRKYDKVFNAAALACAPIAPSRETPDNAFGGVSSRQQRAVTQQLYFQFDPGSRANPVMPARLDRKLSYSFANTQVLVLFEDRNSQPVEGTVTYNPLGDDFPDPLQRIPYYPHEVGWQDPITVTVYHDFALLPGAGGMFSKAFELYDRMPDSDKHLLVPRVERPDDGVYKILIHASATMTNEGIRSVRPFVHNPYP